LTLPLISASAQVAYLFASSSPRTTRASASCASISARHISNMSGGSYTSGADKWARQRSIIECPIVYHTFCVQNDECAPVSFCVIFSWSHEYVDEIGAAGINHHSRQRLTFWALEMLRVCWRNRKPIGTTIKTRNIRRQVRKIIRNVGYIIQDLSPIPEPKRYARGLVRCLQGAPRCKAGRRRVQLPPGPCAASRGPSGPTCAP